MLLQHLSRQGRRGIRSAMALAPQIRRNDLSLVAQLSNSAEEGDFQAKWEYEGISPGSELDLKIENLSQNTHVKIKCGAPDALQITASYTAAPSSPPLSPEDIARLSQVSEKPLVSHSGHKYTHHTFQFQGPKTSSLPPMAQAIVTAHVPAKFFNITMDVDASSVSIDRVSDAEWLIIKSHGGDVALNNPKAGTVNVATDGGKISGSATGAFVVLCTGEGLTPYSVPDIKTLNEEENSRNAHRPGGDIAMQNITGKDVFVSTARGVEQLGKANIGAIYAESGNISCGDLNCGTMFCSEAAKVSIAPGCSASISGVDGSLELTSEGSGGHVEVYMNQNAKDIKLHSRNSDTELLLSPDAAYNVTIRGQVGKVSFPPSIKFKNENDGVYTAAIKPSAGGDHAVGPPSRLYRGGEGDEGGDAECAHVDIVSDAGGTVAIQYSSWREQAMKRSQLKL